MSVMVHVGYGKHSWDVTLPDVLAVQPLALTRATFVVTAAVWSKTSFAITVYRLSSPKVKWALIFIVVSMNLAMGLGCVFSWVTCRPIRKAWDPAVEGTCWSIQTLNKYSLFSSSYSGVMDVVLAIIPWTLLWNVQMRLKEKIGVLVAMSMGILAGIVAFIKCAKINNLSSGDLYNTAQLLVWDSAEVSVTIVAASIPALRILIREVNNSARQYYASSGARNTRQSASNPGTSRRATFVKLDGSTDAQSDKSILHSPDAIWYQTEITVQHTSTSNENCIELPQRKL
ncbi:hypothetical protein Sste5346_006318 [Sporothrix stenoceras]|uniref:Rhodopsin domain-containing protein n=1 Tax=Sporothrix stenoceras TaxID=5173 RepID=A0ABR3Z086_9PEZI